MSDNNLIEVRIRHEEDADGVRLCMWPANEIDAVVETVNRWGVRVSGDRYSDNTAVGSFVYEDGEAYFEVMLAVEE